jgi:hypothetical protein
MRQCCALQLLREKWPLTVRLPVHYDRAAGYERKSGAGPSILERFAGDHCYCRQISVHRCSYISNSCREQNFMSTSSQRLREPLQQRRIGADENHFCHY